MKKLFTILLLLVSVLAFSQNNGINFQGVGRNSSGAVLASTKISLRFSVIQSSQTGTVEYLESKEVTTNAQGIFSVVIGDGTQTSKTGNFSDINWKINPKFLKVEMDPAGGSSFVSIGTTRLQSVPFAYYANGVNADNVDGVLSASKGGTGVASISALKTALAIDQINNTSDLAKPISTATQAALDLKANTNEVTNSLVTKVDKVAGKGLSTNDFTTAEKNKLTAITGINTGDQDLSGYATTIALESKANSNDVTASLATKVDKVTGKGLSTNDFTTSEKNKLMAITGTNTGDQDLSGYATLTELQVKANTSDLLTSLATKVDKVTGKGLSTNDFTTAEKNKLTAITGTNTGDQDLSAYATKTELQEKESTSDVLTRLSTKVDKVTGKGLSSNDFTTAEKNKLILISGTNTGDQDLSFLATKEELEDSEDYIDANFAKLDEENIFTADQEIDGELTLGQINLYGETNSYIGPFPFDYDALLVNNDEYIYIGSFGEDNFQGWGFDIEENSIDLPNESSIKTVSGETYYENGIHIDNIPNSNFIITTTEPDGDYYSDSRWRFTPSGELIFPDDTKMYNNYGYFRIENENGVSINSTQVDYWTNIEYESRFWSEPGDGIGIYLANNDYEFSSGVSINHDFQNNQFYVEIYTDEDNNWIFDAEGQIRFPDGTTFGNNDEGEVGFITYDNDDFFIKTTYDDDDYETYYWYFKRNGDLILPNETKLGESEAGIGFTTNENNDFFINTSNFNYDTEELISYEWLFKSNGILKLPEDGDIVDWQNNSVISRFISEEFFVTYDTNYDDYNNFLGIDISESGLDYDSGNDYKINIIDEDDNSIADGDCTSFDLKIELNHQPKDPENINVFIYGMKIPKRNIYSNSPETELNYIYEEEIDGSHYLIIKLFQSNFFEGFDNIIHFSIDYRY